MLPSPVGRSSQPRNILLLMKSHWKRTLRLKDVRIRPKLLSLFILTGIIPLLTVGYFETKWSKDSLISEAFGRLTTIQQIRKDQIEKYFQEVFADTQILAASDRILDLVAAIEDFERVEKAMPSESLDTQGETFKKITEQFRAPLQEYQGSYGYNNLYVIDAEHGHIIFSLQNGPDNGTNLQHGRYKNSPLAATWNQAMNSNTTIMTDFEPYAPMGNSEVAFVAHPVIDTSGRKVAILVVSFTSEFMSRIVQYRQGMGTTGESYILGWQENKNIFEFRSEMQTMGRGEYIVGFHLDKNIHYWQDALKAGLTGGHGLYVDSLGDNVLVAFNKLDVRGLEWFLISKIDKYEVTAPVREIYRKVTLFALCFMVLIGIGAWLLSRSFTQPIIAGIDFAESITKGEFDTKLILTQKDEMGELARSLNSMARTLLEIDWLKSGKEELDDDIRGEHQLDEIAQRCIRFFVKHLDGELGAIYLNDRGTLNLKASYSFIDRGEHFNTFALGEGMVGQVAAEGEMRIFSNMTSDAPSLNYGAEEQVPPYFMLVPISEGVDIVGVMLIGSLAPFSTLHKKFVSQTIPNMAVLFNAAQSRQRIAELLKSAQIHQEELRVTNEELEEQTRALRKSEAELQAQQEELRVTNEELQERSKVLEEQKNEIWATNSDLKEAQEIVENKAKELEIASKYKSEFLANMSHELRTPLNSILILSQLFANNKGGNLTEKQIESASAIHSSGSELLTLINEILDLSKVEAGKIDLMIEDVPMNRIESDLNRLYKDIAENKGVSLQFTRDNNAPDIIHTDSQRLQQVLRNLLTNAFKFTDHGTVSLTISRPQPELVQGTALDPAQSIAFAVSDEGIGIPEEKQAVIFEAFQQADGSTSRKYGGTGLGLSISRELTRLLGGTIHLHSVKNQGSTFTIILPESYTPQDDDSLEPKGTETQSSPVAAPGRPVPQPPAEPSPAEDSRAATPPNVAGEVDDDRRHIHGDSKSLLIIEDDNKFSLVMRDFARERGFKCIIAEDGETGLHFADYYNPSAIILDIGLPGIDGWTVMERLKNNPKLRHIPVHFMSAADSTMDAMRMGAIGYLTKPVSVEKIEETFGKLENIISKPVSKLLLVEDDSLQRQSIKDLIGNSDVTTTAVGTGAEAYRELEKETYDCMVLDLGLEDMSGFELLEKIRQNEKLTRVPVIVYTGRDLTMEEENQLRSYAESIIIKGAKSPERLLDESALFLHRVEANLPEEKRQMLKMVHNKEAVLSGRKILLVDDDMRNVFALTSVLEERNIDIVVARDGVESLEKLQQTEGIDAILMDIMMPRMDGYEAMRKIREQPQYKDLPIIALTAKAMKGDRSKCIEAGASDYLAKPVNPDKLLSMLRVWLY